MFQAFFCWLAKISPAKRSVEFLSSLDFFFNTFFCVKTKESKLINNSEMYLYTFNGQGFYRTFLL